MINQFDSVCRYVADSGETQIRFRIDATGTITKVEGMDPVSKILVKGFFKPAQSMLRFSPATRSGKEVDSQLILRLSVPDRSTSITEKDPGERKLTPMPVHSVDMPMQVTATIHFDGDGEILGARVAEGTPTALGTAVIQAVRSWRYPAEGPLPTLTCRFGFEPGQPEAFFLDEPEEVIVVIPEPIKQVPPIYPSSLARIGVEGIVRASLVVDTDGRVQDIEIIRSSHPLFSEAAIKSLEGWRFTPGTYDGEPASFRMMQPLRFNFSR
jgi:protein TonB